MGQFFPFATFGSGNGGSSSAGSNSAGKKAASGLKPNTPASLIDLSDGSTVETGNADAQGKITFAFSPLPGRDYIIDGSVRLSAGSGAVVAPAAPTMTLTAGNGQVSIGWTDGATGGSAITSHKLYRGTVSGSLSLVGTITTASPYVDAGLTNGTAYIYQLTAVNGAGESVRSAEATATASAAGPFALTQLPTGARLANWDVRNTASMSLVAGAAESFADSVGAVTLLQTSPIRRPTYVANGWDGTLPCLTFNGASSNGQMMNLLGTAFADQMWVFMVLERNATQNNGAGGTTKTILRLARPVDDLVSGFSFSRASLDTTPPASVQLAPWGGGSVVSAIGGIVGGEKGLIWANMGKQIRTNSGSGAVSAAAPGSAALRTIDLGGTTSIADNAAAFKLAEILIIDPRTLKGGGTDSQRWAIEGLLAQRWGTQSKFADGHPYKLAAPTSADWTNNARVIYTWGNSLMAGMEPHVSGTGPLSVAGGEFAGVPYFGGGVGGDTSTQIRARFDAAATANPKMLECCVVIGECYANGNGFGTSVTPDVEYMADRVLAAGGKPIVLGKHVFNLNGYGTGGGGKIDVDANDAYLLNKYGQYFCRVTEFVRLLGAPGAPYDDPVAWAAGKPPPAAFVDNTHYVGDVYQRAGNFIGQFIKDKGFVK